jgi:hypothetical protein
LVENTVVVGVVSTGWLERLSIRGSDDARCATARRLTAAITASTVKAAPTVMAAMDRLRAVESISIPEATVVPERRDKCARGHPSV